MQFTAREDIEAPIEHVFAMATDFGAFERQVLRRGAQIQRLDSKTETGVGMAWKIGFEFRGRKREMESHLVDYDVPNRLVMEGKLAGLGGDLVVNFIALSRNRTRMDVVLELKPQTITAKVMVQSLRLGKSGLLQKFRRRVGEFAKTIENRVPGRV